MINKVKKNVNKALKTAANGSDPKININTLLNKLEKVKSKILADNDFYESFGEP